MYMRQAQDRAVAAKAAAQEAKATREKQEEGSDGGLNVEGTREASSVSDAARPDAASRPDAAGRPDGAGRPAAVESAAAHESYEGHGGVAHALMRAAETYAAMAQRGVMPPALAPGGTGISLQI